MSATSFIRGMLHFIADCLILRRGHIIEAWMRANTKISAAKFQSSLDRMKLNGKNNRNAVTHNYRKCLNGKKAARIEKVVYKRTM